MLSVGGKTIRGVSFGANVSVSGELVFQTGHAGYTQSLTDPSYAGQILVLTQPLVGNYGTSLLEKWLESSKIHIAGLVVQSYATDYSHWTADCSLGAWLAKNNIPALHAVDTRALTKLIRNNGPMLATITIGDNKVVEMVDPNLTNLVAQVSTKKVTVYQPETPLKVNGKALTVLAIDVGIKSNQIRCMTQRGITLTVCPWDHEFNPIDYDGIFISNGPGDPALLTSLIARIKKLIDQKVRPVFGICLGHQLLALASGASTCKLPYGNRGQNIPCTNLQTGRCFITSQNHGYAVVASSLQDGWKEYFINANDNSNEGIIHDSLPFFSVQFHPESSPGPWDTEFLFDKFIASIKACKKAGKLVPLEVPAVPVVPPRLYPRKVLVLGSGGLSIGQAGEFDYSGSQAIKALKEEGIYTVLINPNIATIQTSRGLADKVYFLPVTAEFVRKVIKHEKPDGIYVTFGGQTALNVGVKLKDEFESLGVKVLGTPIRSIEITEDRELFAKALEEIGEKTAKSHSAVNVKQAIAAADDIGYPVIIRAAYALGGLGSGFANNQKELVALCQTAFANSPQVLVERSMKGWKEIEYEVVRDSHDNVITVCNMENFDPLGIHTGDSIVVAPSQTLTDHDYMMLRRTAINVIRHIGVVGECNIQYAMDPNSDNYCIIEVNARLSRSSALASKATGYPLAFVAAKLGLNIPLTSIKNTVTKKTVACFEPSLDYIVVKIPRWDLKKFSRVSTKISSQMKSVGEVMAIGRTFEETMQKAIRAVEGSFIGFSENQYVFGDELEDELSNPSDQRVFAIANALYSGYTVQKLWELTKIDKWFLNKLKNIVDLDLKLKAYNVSTLTPQLILQCKQLGFSDRQVAKSINTTELGFRKLRKEHGVTPFVKQIDTVSAEFPCFTNYLYTTYNASEHDVEFTDNGVMVLGSGVYRIGSSVEFDWCAVRCIRTLRELGRKTIMVNYNPETVSTDYDEADRLYFETLTLERVLDIYELEHSSGVVVSMGGQTPNNIALPLFRENVKILGTSPEMIDGAENRYKFSRMLDKIGVDQPRWKELASPDEACAFCSDVGYPVLVRPSYVLSGAGMTVVHSEPDLLSYLTQAGSISLDHPVVVSKFIEDAKEIEMDAVAHNGKLIMHVVTEHVENAGVHSGDATLILPPQDLDPETVRKIEIATAKIANALQVTGPCNIQFIAKNNEIKVIECNVRASRSFPFVSKVMGVDLISLATRALVDEPYVAYPNVPEVDFVAVKVPQFSFSRLQGADPILGVEMASTGEVACFGATKYEAYMKALVATGFTLPKQNILLSIGSFKEKLEFLPSVRKLHEMGFKIYATAGTADFITEHSIPCAYLEVLEDDSTDDAQKLEYSLSQHLANNLVDLYINLPSKNQYRRPASYLSRGYRSRRMAVDKAIPLITNIKCAKLFVEALSRHEEFEVSAIDCQTTNTTYILPGLVSIRGSADNSKEAIQGGVTMFANLKTGPIKSFCDYTLAAQAGHVGDGCVIVPPGSSPVAIQELMVMHTGLIVTCAREELATVLFLAHIHQRAVHCQVYSRNDIKLVSVAKTQGVRVTCDMDIFTFESEYYDCLDDIDVLSSNGEYLKALVLLLTAVRQGKLEMLTIADKMSVMPRRIFGLPEHDSYVEVELGRVSSTENYGFVHRVVVHGQTVLLDGAFHAEMHGKRLITTKSTARLSKVVNAPSNITGSPVRGSVVLSSGGAESPRTRLFIDRPGADGKMIDIEPVEAVAIPKYPAFFRKHIVSVLQFKRPDLHILFGIVQEMKAAVAKNGGLKLLEGKVMCSAFWEPSTRTSSSFEAAMCRLGGSVVSINQITSSIAKGESLGDTGNFL